MPEGWAAEGAGASGGSIFVKVKGQGGGEIEIRPLVAARDVALVAAFYHDAPEYWLMAEGTVPGLAKARAFFVDCPPGCDPGESLRWGVFLLGRLSGLVEVSFGFPGAGDVYLGTLILGPWAQGRGIGRAVLDAVEARVTGARLYLAVLDANPRGRAFWQRVGFVDTGLSGTYAAGGVSHVVRRMVKAL